MIQYVNSATNYNGDIIKKGDEVINYCHYDKYLYQRAKIINIQKHHLGHYCKIEFEDGVKKIRDINWLRKVEKEPVRIFTPEDPYGEEEWIEEKLITKFKIFENFDDYSYIDSVGNVRIMKIYGMCKDSNSVIKMTKFENYLKPILIGKTVDFEGGSTPTLDNHDNHPDTRRHRYFIKVKDVHVTKEGSGASSIYLISNENEIYFANCNKIKIVDEDIIKRNEEARLKHLEFDPYSEEDWLD